MKGFCEEVMSRNVQTCKESDPASRAAQLMRDNNIGLIPIVDAGGRAKGVVTDRDLALRLIADRKNADTPLKEIMSKEPLLAVSPSDKLSEAEEKMMQSGKGRVLVTDSNGRVVGVISRSEIARNEDAARAGEVLGSLTRSHRARAKA